MSKDGEIVVPKTEEQDKMEASEGMLRSSTNGSGRADRGHAEEADRDRERKGQHPGWGGSARSASGMSASGMSVDVGEHSNYSIVAVSSAIANHTSAVRQQQNNAPPTTAPGPPPSSNHPNHLTPTSIQPDLASSPVTTTPSPPLAELTITNPLPNPQPSRESLA